MIELSQVSRSFTVGDTSVGDQQVARGIDLYIAAGDYVSIMGRPVRQVQPPLK